MKRRIINLLLTSSSIVTGNIHQYCRDEQSGFRLWQLGILDSTKIFQEKTLEIFPHYEIGLINLAKTYIVEKNYEKAYQVILSCDPKTSNEEVLQIKQYLESTID
ncbi:MAG: hypothetical protein R2764_03000 [Bacteroidales bacterium]